MKKSFNAKIIVLRIMIALVALPMYASSEIPENTMDSTIDAPPTGPIDNYLTLTILICIVFVGYFFYKSNKSLLKE